MGFKAKVCVCGHNSSSHHTHKNRACFHIHFNEKRCSCLGFRRKEMTEEKKDAPNNSLDALLALNASSSSKKEDSSEEVEAVVDTAPLESPVKKVHVLSGVRVLATDAEIAEYHTFHGYVEEALKDKNFSDLTPNDPYWDVKAVLDTFVAHLERA